MEKERVWVRLESVINFSSWGCSGAVRSSPQTGGEFRILYQQLVRYKTRDLRSAATFTQSSAVAVVRSESRIPRRSFKKKTTSIQFTLSRALTLFMQKQAVELPTCASGQATDNHSAARRTGSRHRCFVDKHRAGYSFNESLESVDTTGAESTSYRERT